MNRTDIKNTSYNYDVVIIGGGASGLMAALIASQASKAVCIIEKNKELGKKLSITGGGRCNITNAEFDIKKMLANYGTSADFLYSAFSIFSHKDTFDFFNNHGLPLSVQEKNRVFPVSEKATDVTNFFRERLQNKLVTIKTGCTVQKILNSGDHITGIEIINSQKDRETISAKSYVLATGGMSHPETGSTGDGFTFLRDLGHTIIHPTPSLVPIVVREKWIYELSGTVLKNATIVVYCDDIKKFQKKGDILLTHFGLSGPTILNTAAQVSDLLPQGTVTARIDMFTGLDQGSLEKEIIHIFDNHKNKSLKNVLTEIGKSYDIPTKLMASITMLLSEINFETPVHSVSKSDRKKIVVLLKSIPITITGLKGYNHAIIADGGIPLSEINMKTMRSHIYDNLYITGDLLHIRRPSGGFSLQICWTTGYIAGISA